MSRLLAELLGAPELIFRGRLRQLEVAAGAPAHDVSLTAGLIQTNRQKLSQLGLDAHDTTPKELYASLNQRYIADNTMLVRDLARQGQLNGQSNDIMSMAASALRNVKLLDQCLALKSSAAKKLLKASVPKVTMKLLKYRSIDSMIKHEPAAVLLATAELLEPASWQRNYAKAMLNIRATDFEVRPMTIIYLSDARWSALSAAPQISKRHHLIEAPLHAKLVLLPYSTGAPTAAMLTTVVMVAQAINRLAASSSYLKIHQMRPDLAEAALSLATHKSSALLELLGEPVSWQLVQRYYDRFKNYYQPQLFEPYLQAEDFTWFTAEALLRQLAPNLSFWQNTDELAMNKGDQVVSYNLADIALNVCNKLNYESRQISNVQQSLWQELQMRYLQPGHVEQAVLTHMQPAFAVVA